MPTAQKPKEKVEEYVIREIPIDRYNKHRIRVRITESVCRKCGTDICEINGLPAYADLPPEQQLKVDATLERHMSRHIPAEERVVTKEQLSADIPEE